MQEHDGQWQKAIAFGGCLAHLSKAMPLVESTQKVPLSASEDGTLWIAGTRVSLESVVHHYEQGATAEEIVLRYPALRLADVHSCLAYYLNHQAELREYLAGQRLRAEELRERIAADRSQQSGLARMRERIGKRLAAGAPEVR